MSHEHTWNNAQAEEAEWWGTCANTLGEELKQLVYANRMGIEFKKIDGIPYQIDLQGKRVLDVGGGPTSLLLKSFNHPKCMVVDPCDYPKWVSDRYTAAGVTLARLRGEDIGSEERFDEVWLYNCLQHVDNPKLIIENCLRAVKPGGTFRIFEWINTPVNEAHPVSLTYSDLAEWTGQAGNIENLNEMGCVGTAYYDTIKVGDYDESEDSP